MTGHENARPGHRAPSSLEPLALATSHPNGSRPPSEQAAATRFAPGDLPAQIRSETRFMLWKQEPRAGGRLGKIPVDATGRKIDHTDPAVWRSLPDVHRDAAATGFGIAFALGDGWTGVDLDRCRNPETSELTPWASEILETFPGWYWEVSQSRTGLKGIGRTAVLPVLPGDTADGRQGTSQNGLPDYSGEIGGQIETAVGGRMFCLTGDVVNAVGRLEDSTSQYAHFVWARFMATPKRPPNGTATSRIDTVSLPPFIDPVLEVDEIIRRGRAEKNGKFARLFDDGNLSEYAGDDSAADQALACKIAFYTRDPEKIEAVFNRSRLGERKKWRLRADYRNRTITTALEVVQETYLRPGDGPPLRNAPDTEVSRLRAQISADAQIRRNPGLRTATALALALPNILASLMEHQAPDDQGRYVCRLALMADEAGISPSTASKQAKAIADAGGIRCDTVPVIKMRAGDRPQVEREIRIGLPDDCATIADLRAKLATIDLRSNHGGRREPTGKQRESHLPADDKRAEHAAWTGLKAQFDAPGIEGAGPTESVKQQDARSTLSVTEVVKKQDARSHPPPVKEVDGGWHRQDACSQQPPHGEPISLADRVRERGRQPWATDEEARR
jgi:hypothetical protein